jgi:hypothetical protein
MYVMTRTADEDLTLVVCDAVSLGCWVIHGLATLEDEI